ncbi:hypothetical protein TWF730_005155 [Orbilia blumenaviensis]|uniref:Vesicular, overexpressed in cancer, prosurvival protein 1 n=1 Tax=Orbilia blumenaviensis TaxID=1796055 RepID=A0AAV9VKB2_9PEZI
MVALPRDEIHLLAKRAYYNCDATGCYYSPWYHWQRWAVLGALLAFSAVVLLLCACLSARRRRSRGLSPFYGTAWAAPPAYDVHSIPQNNHNTGPQYGGYTYASTQQPQYNPAGSPPVYSPPSNAGYYGQQETGTTYTGGQNYEMNNFGGSSAPYIPPRPEETHKR